MRTCRGCGRNNEYKDVEDAGIYFDTNHEADCLASKLGACLEGQEALKAQTVRIRRLLPDHEQERDTEDLVRDLAARLREVSKFIDVERHAQRDGEFDRGAWWACQKIEELLK